MIVFTGDELLAIRKESDGVDRRSVRADIVDPVQPLEATRPFELVTS